jgi:phosphotransferase system HPr-like phosphotransfer protein
MNERPLEVMKELAAELAVNLLEDVRLASTRIEHVRLTARANEAARLVEQIERLIQSEESTQIQVP